MTYIERCHHVFSCAWCFFLGRHFIYCETRSKNFFGGRGGRLFHAVKWRIRKRVSSGNTVFCMWFSKMMMFKYFCLFRRPLRHNVNDSELVWGYLLITTIDLLPRSTHLASFPLFGDSRNLFLASVSGSLCHQTTTYFATQYHCFSGLTLMYFLFSLLS